MKRTKYTALAAVACFVASAASAGVVARYTFDDASNLGANSGTASLVWDKASGVTATNGVFGGAGAFVAGTSKYWQSSFSRATTDFGEFSVSMHVRGTGSAWKDYFSFGVGGSTIFLEQSDSGFVLVESAGDPGGQGVHIEGTTAVNDGNWHHLGLVSDGTNITLYIDGVAEGTPSAYTGSGIITSLQLASRLGDLSRSITADLDDVGIFDTALTSVEMAWFSSNAIPEPDALPAATGFATAEPVDPRFPKDRQAEVYAGWSRRPWVRIHELEVERDGLLEKISVLPQHDPKPMPDHLGYHSLFEDPGSDASLLWHQIDFKWNWFHRMDSIALAPAFNPEGPEGEAYAFPKRFKIEVLRAKTGGFETVVDWMEKDFPDPGPYPVFFADINRFVKQVRITVPQVVRDLDVSYYALGEVYLFRQKKNGRIGDNMAIWGSPGTETTVSDSFSMPPLWDTHYMHDRVEGLGLPLSDETVSSEDLMVVYDAETPFADKVQLTMDLGSVQPIGRIDFWPAAAPHLLALPSFGFPEKISLELSPDPDFITAKVLEVENAGGHMYRGNLLSVMATAYRARYIRISLEGLREYKGQRILGLGEISVSEFETVLSANCKVTAQGIPEEYLDQLPRLVDGYSQQRRILSQGEWIKGLAKRRPLDRRLVVVERELEEARVAWRLIQRRIGVWGGSAVVAGLILGMVLQRRQRYRILDRLKWRIARDLHDEVGSNLGSISLVAERLENDIQDVEVKEDLVDLSLLAREASASLRDVVWVIDQTTIRLPELVQTLAGRAQRVLNDIELSVETSQDCPDMVVPLTFKRHLIMFFKEAVHNCARHAHATKVQIAVSTKNQQLCVRVSDNGCGFDPAVQKDGWGLDSMQKRAQELGGTMKVESQPGQGTTVELTVPLKALLKNTDHLYKTSN